MTSTQTPKICTHALERDLCEHLLALNFHAFLHAIAQLLTKMGYVDVALAGRTDWVGRRMDGGCDLVAFQPVPGGKRRVIVQVKQYRERPVYRRAVDELRGVCLRAGASEAILITTSSFSPLLDKSRLSSALVAPVRLIDGEQLADLMVLHQVGSWEEPPTSPDEPASFGVDESFFTDLCRVYGAGLAGPRVRPRSRKADLVFLVALRPSRRRRIGARGTKRAALPQRS